MEVVGAFGISEACKRLNWLLWMHDSDPSGKRLKWYKKRHDHYLKPSQLRHRRARTVERRRRYMHGRYPHLDGFAPHSIEDLHWS